MGRTYNCWMLNCWCITWPVGFKRLNKSDNLKYRTALIFIVSKKEVSIRPTTIGFKAMSNCSKVQNSEMGLISKEYVCFLTPQISQILHLWYRIDLQRDKLYNRTNEMHFLSFIFDNILYMFRIVKLFIIRRQCYVQLLIRIMLKILNCSSYMLPKM